MKPFTIEKQKEGVYRVMNGNNMVLDNMNREGAENLCNKLNQNTPQSNIDWREEALDSFMGVIIANSEGLIDNGKGEGYSYAHSVYLNNIKEEFKPIISQLLEAEKKQWREEGESIKKAYVNKEIVVDVDIDDYNRSVFNAGVDAVLQKLS